MFRIWDFENVKQDVRRYICNDIRTKFQKICQVLMQMQVGFDRTIFVV